MRVLDFARDDSREQDSGTDHIGGALLASEASGNVKSFNQARVL
jgi:hypothetical protein